ncbi:MAG: peptide chain release factor 1 [Bacteroidia bacterium]
MWARVDKLVEKYAFLTQQLQDPEIFIDPARYRQVAKEHKYLSEIVRHYQAWKKADQAYQEAKQTLEETQDPELKVLAKEEIQRLTERLAQLEEALKLSLLPPDPDDDKGVIVEIRAGTGGDEAALFAGDLFRMYQRFCEKKGWRMEIQDYTPGNVGGYKEIIAEISGQGVYSWLKYEGGIHRVQRIPQTETQGRIHTSAASVAILPQPEEIDIEIKESDIRKDTFCSSGHGGQSVNTTYSAVRVVHIPTGITVTIQNERSQIKNYEVAMRILRARLYEMELQKRRQAEEALRKTHVSTGDRSAKIRTYNFPQNRVTDHRIQLTLYNLNEVLAGEMEPLLEALRLADRTQQLQSLDLQAVSDLGRF